MEYKTTAAFSTRVDGDEGIIETIFAVMGNVDKGKDRIWPGAFAKTFSESGHKVRVLDHHRTGTIMSVLGKPLELRELARNDLPKELVENCPEATGGAWAKIQFLMDTPEGQGAFARIKSGAVGDWSFGYDALDSDYSKEDKDGEQFTVRNLRTVRLFELSPVLWGMNSATETLSAKAVKADLVGIFKEDDRWHLYYVDDEGKRSGESLADYGSHGEAVDAAAKRNSPEEESEKADPPAEPPTTCVCPECGAEKAKERGEPCRAVDCPKCGAKMEAKIEEKALSNVLQGSIHREFTRICDTWYIEGLLNRDERIMLSSLIGDALALLEGGIPDELAQRQANPVYGIMSSSQEIEEKASKPSHYLVVEDPEKSSTWHLPVRNDDGTVNHRLMGAAWAALTVGYRGNKYQGPDKEKALAKLRKLYASEKREPPGEKAMEIAEAMWVYYQDEDTDGFTLDEKAGRVLSQRNAIHIERAIEELVEVLRSAGLRPEGPSGRLTLWKAGSDNPPTSDKELALLMKGLEMELFQASIDLEV